MNQTQWGRPERSLTPCFHLHTIWSASLRAGPDIGIFLFRKTWKIGARRWEGQGHPQLHSQNKASLGYIRSFLKKNQEERGRKGKRRWYRKRKREDKRREERRDRNISNQFQYAVTYMLAEQLRGSQQEQGQSRDWAVWEDRVSMSLR